MYLHCLISVRLQRWVAPTGVQPYRQVRSKQQFVQQNIEIKPKANGMVFNNQNIYTYDIIRLRLITKLHDNAIHHSFNRGGCQIVDIQ